MKGLDVKREAGVNPARSRHCIRGVWDMCKYMYLNSIFLQPLIINLLGRYILYVDA